MSDWPHLEGLGINVPDAYTPPELRTGPRGSPYTTRTLLGWVLWCITRNDISNNIKVNRAQVTAIEEYESLFTDILGNIPSCHSQYFQENPYLQTFRNIHIYRLLIQSVKLLPVLVLFYGSYLGSINLVNCSK